MTARVRRIDAPTYQDLWREAPTAFPPDMWDPDQLNILSATHAIGLKPRLPWATMYVRPTREVG